MGTRLLRAGAIYTSANVLSAGVPFLLLPILTRALAPSEYGQVVAFFLLLSVASSIAGLNVHSAVAVRWFDREYVSLPRSVGTAVVLALVSTLVCALLLAAAANGWRDSLALTPWMWPLAAFTAGMTTLLNLRIVLWQMQQRPWPAAAMQVGGATLNMALSLTAVLLLGFGAAGRNVAVCAAATVLAVAGVLMLSHRRELQWAIDLPSLRYLLRFGLPLVPHALAGAALATTDRYTVAALLGPDALGVYGVAAQLGMVLNVLSDAVVKAATPWLYAQLARSGARGRLRLVAVTYASLPVAVGVAVATWLLFVAIAPLLLGARYQTAADLSLWFLLGGALTAVYHNIAALYFFNARTGRLAIATTASALAAAVIAPTMAVQYGLEGAAASFCLVQGLQLLFAWALSHRVRPLPWSRAMLGFRLFRRQLVIA